MIDISPRNAFLIAGASQRWWESCSYRKCPQGGSTSSCSALVPLATRALRKVSFLGCELEWNVPEQAPKPFYLTTSSPLKLRPSPLASCFTWQCSLLGCLGGCTPKESWAGDPNTGRPAIWAVFCVPPSQRVGPSGFQFTKDSGPSQGKPARLSRHHPRPSLV